MGRGGITIIQVGVRSVALLGTLDVRSTPARVSVTGQIGQEQG